jgi:hypothetical protein
VLVRRVEPDPGLAPRDPQRPVVVQQIEVMVVALDDPPQ